jgi:molybdate transport system ATP-binding protein
MTLAVDIRASRGAFHLDARFASRGGFTALFGASGSGKSTLIDAIAGLITPDEGRISIDERILVDTQAGIFIARHKRRIGYVFQDARLFPHLSVEHNLLYGRWFAAARLGEDEVRIVIALLGIGHLLKRYPHSLSGGEKQRVAIGRALIANPSLLLMDEPLASLDEPRKAEIMPYLERLRDEARIPIVYVSHSIAEVARLASDIVVLANGRVIASGPTGEIMQRLDLLPPEAQSEGGAVLPATVKRHDYEFGVTVLDTQAGEFRLAGIYGRLREATRLRIRARDVMIATRQPQALSALNILPGAIRRLTPVDRSQVDAAIDCHGAVIIARITALSVDALSLSIGTPVFAIVKTASLDRPGLANAAV